MTLRSSSSTLFVSGANDPDLQDANDEQPTEAAQSENVSVQQPASASPSANNTDKKSQSKGKKGKKGYVRSNVVKLRGK